MSKRVFRLPSPALVIAMVALALVLGGTAVAATTSGTPLTKTTGTKLIKHLAPTLSVKHAKTAGDATTVGGQTVKKIQWKVAPSTATQTILSAGGLTITGSCDSSSNITVDANGPSGDDGEIRIQGQSLPGGSFVQNMFNFGHGDVVSLVGTDGGQLEGSGDLVFATNDGHVLTFDYGFDYGTSTDAYDHHWQGCTLYGQAIYS
jgi:hypothetical protein